MYTNIIFIFEYIFYKPNVKALTKAVRGFSTSVSIMWPINGLEVIQSEIKKITKIKNKTTLPPSFLDESGRETNIFFYLAKKKTIYNNI